MNNFSIIWFRRDLRLSDNPAWNAAVKQQANIIPLYIHCPEEDGLWQRGGASSWWLHHALVDLKNQLEEQNLKLITIDASKSSSHVALQNIIKKTKASSVFWNRCYEKSCIQRDGQIKKSLSASGLTVKSFNGSLLLDPLDIRNKSGKPFQVFTPFWKHCRNLKIHTPETLKHTYSSKIVDIKSDSIDSLHLLPSISWDRGMQDFWKPLREGGVELLNTAQNKSSSYIIKRDIPSVDGTSRLSPYLHFGQISPREFLHHIRAQSINVEKADHGILRQLYWREFSAHLLYHFPHSQDTSLKPEYDQFPWEFDEQLLRCWQRGQTGFPIVDAGMRQLWHTGWMHNRTRMIAGSLLVKHLLQPWQEGARWFWDTLVDADLANNSMGWQWVAGSGADASPYFRIFNPIIQGKKFDTDGDYVRKWCPELTKLPNNLIHTPWEATPMELLEAGVTLGKDYPKPVISHEKGRDNALEAYNNFKNKNKSI